MLLRNLEERELALKETFLTVILEVFCSLNTYLVLQAMEKNVGKKFFECQPSFWDEINSVGLRNVYICSVLASRMMVARRRGLIVNISSAAGIHYFFNVAYGVGKAAVGSYINNR